MSFVILLVLLKYPSNHEFEIKLNTADDCLLSMIVCCRFFKDGAFRLFLIATSFKKDNCIIWQRKDYISLLTACSTSKNIIAEIAQIASGGLQDTLYMK